MADSRYKNNNAGDIVNGPDGAVRKQKVAVALQYNKGEQAPKIIASGKGHIADKIIEKAKDSDVPTYEEQQALPYSF